VTVLSLMMILLLGCFGLVLLAALVVGLIYIMQSSRGDTVSLAREDWISAGSEEDEQE